jgi:Ca-activated chloride channel family protein
MSIQSWFRLPRIRKSLAAGAVILATGGLVLARSPASARSAPDASSVTSAQGSNSAAFTGPGAHGRVALSHRAILAGGEQRVFAQIDLAADRVERNGKERAPLAIAVVLDTSGSMAGEKIEQAKRSVIQLIRDMRDDDEIAVVRYASDREVVQGLAKVGRVREALVARVGALSAGGGTDIPPALREGLRALDEAGAGRVRRVILASDGLDSTRAVAEQVAREAAGRGVTVSSMGIGLDFDEGYMGGLAQAGHGNFAFVKDASALAGFLKRELDETAATTIERAAARLRLPAGVRFVRAIGAEARVDGAEVALTMGSLFAGDERRVVLELAASADAGELRAIDGRVTWDRVGGGSVDVRVGGLAIAGTNDAQAVEAGRDGAVMAVATSTFASVRQLEAAEAYQRGDVGRAQAIIDGNMADLRSAAAAAPAASAAPLEEQMREYEKTKKVFAAEKPQSEGGRARAKAAAARDLSNMGRAGF